MSYNCAHANRSPTQDDRLLQRLTQASSHRLRSLSGPLMAGRYDLIQARVSHDEKKRVERQAAAAGLQLSDYVRQRLFEGDAAVVAIGSAATPAPGPGSQEDPPGGDEAREAFISRRTLRLGGEGHTTPVARRMAVREWEGR